MNNYTQPRQKLETFALSILFGAIPVLALFIAGWWISMPFVPESRVFLFALAGIALGIIVDVLFLKCWVRRAYDMKPGVWMAVYGFYAVGMFGFFMGFPVFHVLLALPAGAFIGRWLARGGADSARMKTASRQTARFTTAVLGLVCAASGALAITHRSTASEVEHMLGLPFRVTDGMIVGIILFGGAVLLALGWLLTVKAVERVYRFSAAHGGSLTV
jgi:hypothetical protein